MQGRGVGLDELLQEKQKNICSILLMRKALECFETKESKLMYEGIYEGKYAFLGVRELTSSDNGEIRRKHNPKMQINERMSGETRERGSRWSISTLV